MTDTIAFVQALKEFAAGAFKNSREKGFWDGPENDNLPTKVALMHSELSELLEAFRDGNPECSKPITVTCTAVGFSVTDDPLYTPVRVVDRRITSIEEEVADLFIRLGDFCGRYEIDLGAVAIAKMKYNSTRKPMHGGKRV